MEPEVLSEQLCILSRNLLIVFMNCDFLHEGIAVISITPATPVALYLYIHDFSFSNATRVALAQETTIN